MEGSRKIKIPIEKFLKQSWPLLVFGAVLLVGVSTLLFWFAISGKGRKQQTESTQSAQTNATSTENLSDFIPRALDGVLVKPEESRLQPLAVVVENHTDARPLAGPASANLVYEIPVEGGITRYLLVFDATSTIDAVGPVRSARPYFVDFADGLNAVFAHVGGSPEALEKISNMESFRDLNEYFNGKYFWRSKKREAPHNVYTRSDLLKEAISSKKWSEGHFKPWRYKEDDALVSSTATVRGDEQGPKVSYGGSYNVTWYYDKETNDYLREEGGRKQTDQDGLQVKAKNIILMQTDAKVLDAEGRLKLRTTGRGKSVLYRDGKKQDLVWSRIQGEHIRFESIDGSDAIFNRGTSWIEVVVDNSVFNFSSGATSTGTTTSTKKN